MYYGFIVWISGYFLLIIHDYLSTLCYGLSFMFQLWILNSCSYASPIIIFLLQSIIWINIYVHTFLGEHLSPQPTDTTPPPITPVAPESPEPPQTAVVARIQEIMAYAQNGCAVPPGRTGGVIIDAACLVQVNMYSTYVNERIWNLYPYTYLCIIFICTCICIKIKNLYLNILACFPANILICIVHYVGNFLVSHSWVVTLRPTVRDEILDICIISPVLCRRCEFSPISVFLLDVCFQCTISILMRSSALIVKVV